LLHLLTAAVGELATLAVQDPVRLGDRSEPQPDLLLLKPRDDFYAEAHPTATDVLLRIEVSDTTACYDRAIKLGLYQTERRRAANNKPATPMAIMA
jgi:hypothetical protein